MANDYLQFSEVLTHLTAEEEAWLQQQLTHIYVFGDKENTEEEMPENLNPDAADWSGLRLWRNVDDIDYPDDTGFQYEFDDGDKWDDWGRHLWLYAEEYGEPTAVAHLIQQFLKRFRPDQCWGLTFARTCSRMRVGEFGGGAVFVTADAIRWNDTYGFVEEEERSFNTPHGKA